MSVLINEAERVTRGTSKKTLTDPRYLEYCTMNVQLTDLVRG